MTKFTYEQLSKRERQIIEILHEIKEGSVSDVLERITDPPGYNSIRVLMTILEKKGHLAHRNEKNKYIYFAKKDHNEVKQSALKSVKKTFFANSTSNLVSTLLDQENLSADDLDDLSQLIEAAKRKQHD